MTAVEYAFEITENVHLFSSRGRTRMPKTAPLLKQGLNKNIWSKIFMRISEVSYTITVHQASSNSRTTVLNQL